MRSSDSMAKVAQDTQRAPENSPEEARLCCSVRLMIALIGVGTLLLNAATAFNLVIAILCMVKETGKHVDTGVRSLAPEFDWDRTTQGLVLSGFYAGFAVTSALGGLAADLYGAKYLLVVGNLCQGCLALILPVVTRQFGALALGLVRVLQGLTSGVIIPGIFVMFSKWAPQHERTRLLGFAYLGNPLSQIIMLPMSGTLCTVPFDNGWPLIFYVTGGATVAFTLIVQFLMYEWPRDHPLISEREKNYIEASSITPTKKKRPPWKKMIRSGAVLSYTLCSISQQWGFQLMSIFPPDFLKDVMNFDIHKNGFLSAVPFIGMLIMRAAVTISFNWVRVKTNLSLTNLRKLNHAIGTLVPAVTLICMLFIKESPVTCIVLLTINMTVQDLASTGGFAFCNVDFAPAFSGVISGIAMSLSIVVCIAMPNIVAALTSTGTHAEWMIVFYITAGCYFIAFIVYNRFGTSELQPWGLGDEEERQEEVEAAQGGSSPPSTNQTIK